jgi:AAA-like domain
MPTLETLLAFTEQNVYDITGEHLNDLQRLILRESVQDPKKTYEKIAFEYKYSSNYIQQVAAPRLWQLLSKVMGQKVTKSNLRGVLERQLAAQTAVPNPPNPPPTSPTNSRPTAIVAHQARSSPYLIEYPTGSVPLNSPLYVQRSSQESLCYQTILQPNALIRIHGPRQTGKSSLMVRILAHAQAADVQTVTLNFQQVEKPILADLNKLLRWFCTCITQKLKLKPQLDRYWDDDIGSKMSCTFYLEEYLLKEVNSPLVLALEEISELFEYPVVSQEFFGLLRTWHEQSKMDENWKHLRLILVHSMGPYSHLNLHQSPFNIGLAVVLPPFTIDQAEDLVDRHGLQLTAEQIEQLMALVQGQPYLIRWMLYHLIESPQQFEAIMATATTDVGIYQDHLHRHLGNLHRHPDLKQALQQVLSSSTPVQLDQVSAYKLHSIGLVKWSGNKVTIACDLYQQYFSFGLDQVTTVT